jgi:hypothetical protein
LPDLETWTVYEYMNVGSLADLVADYFGSKSKTHSLQQREVFDSMAIALVTKVVKIVSTVIEKLEKEIAD